MNAAVASNDSSMGTAEANDVEDVPCPEDPDLAVLYWRERFKINLRAARMAVEHYPGVSAQVIAHAWTERERHG